MSRNIIFVLMYHRIDFVVYDVFSILLAHTATLKYTSIFRSCASGPGDPRADVSRFVFWCVVE
jgi:hypothetical protein